MKLTPVPLPSERPMPEKADKTEPLLPSHIWPNRTIFNQAKSNREYVVNGVRLTPMGLPGER